MQRKIIFSFGFAAFLLVASLLFIKDTPKGTAVTPPSTCCKKPLNECSGAVEKEAGPATNLENLSHQFI